MYVRRRASSPARCALERAAFAAALWIPTVIGIGIRAAFYRSILEMQGVAAIENGVRLRFADHIREIKQGDPSPAELGKTVHL